jgi:hypothetical protein
MQEAPITCQSSAVQRRFLDTAAPRATLVGNIPATESADTLIIGVAVFRYL